MFRAIGELFWLPRLFRVLNLFHFYVANDNPELAGLALQLGALRMSSNGWKRSLGALKGEIKWYKGLLML